MNILYLCPEGYLSHHFMKGWKNAFEAMGNKFTNIDVQKEDAEGFVRENRVDLIMTSSGEGILEVPSQLINEKKIPVVIAGLPFNTKNITFDPHCPLADPLEMQHIARLDQKVVWSQHEPAFNDYFYSGYKALGIEVIYLPYCADTTRPFFTPEQLPQYDFFFVGGLAHKRKGNISMIRNIFKHLNLERVKVFGDNSWEKYAGIKTSLTKGTDWVQLYHQSAISPNLHIFRQKDKQLLVNDRTFHIPLFGGFQISDNPLTRKFFSEDEVVIGENAKDFEEKFFYYLDHPLERSSFVKKAQQRVKNNHSYFNRIARIFDSLKIETKVRIAGEEYSAVNFKHETKSIESVDLIKYSLETQFYRVGRKIKLMIKK